MNDDIIMGLTPEIVANGQARMAILQKVREVTQKNGYNWTPYGCDLRINAHYAYIFSHEFAIAFFGAEDMWPKTKCTCVNPPDFHAYGHDAHWLDCARSKAKRGYLHHLKEMVVSDDPIKYLEGFL